MTIDFSKPEGSQDYPDLLAAIRDNFETLCKLDPSLGTGVPDGALRVNQSTRTIDKYNESGPSWSALISPAERNVQEVITQRWDFSANPAIRLTNTNGSILTDTAASSDNKFMYIAAAGAAAFPKNARGAQLFLGGADSGQPHMILSSPNHIRMYAEDEEVARSIVDSNLGTGQLFGPQCISNNNGLKVVAGDRISMTTAMQNIGIIQIPQYGMVSGIATLAVKSHTGSSYGGSTTWAFNAYRDAGSVNLDSDVSNSRYWGPDSYHWPVMQLYAGTDYVSINSSVSTTNHTSYAVAGFMCTIVRP